jgi:hypothetical protein
MYLSPTLPFLIAYLTFSGSRKDQDTAQPAVSGRKEAALAAVRQTVVCGMYNLDHRELTEGWDTYVMTTPSTEGEHADAYPRIRGL